MTEPTITCPQCASEIRLTESLAAPLIESTRKSYEEQLARKDAAVLERERELKKREHEIARAKETFEEQVAARVSGERERIVLEEAKKAKLLLQNDLEQRARELTDLKQVLHDREAKLAEAQNAQAELIRKERELDDAKRELELTVEKRVQGSLAAAREQATKEAEERLKLQVAEKEHTISAMQKQIEELKRKAEQGSQQLQGEILELALEDLLRTKFPLDVITPVPKGEFGGDVIHRVISPIGAACGTILWEFKRTKNWSEGWLTKLRDDGRAAKADIVVIVSQALPKEVETFDLIDGVWIAHPRAFLPVALSLRQMLLEVSTARQAADGQQTKMELIYHYLTGPRFRHRIEAIVEAFTTMKEDLDRERRTFTKQWAKREEQIDRVTLATLGMYGDLQGIAGQTLQEIESLSLLTLEES